jgi:hypothetical protein
MILRTFAAALALLTLAACSERVPTQSGQAAAPAGEGGSVTLGSTRNLPDWLLVARQRGCRTDASGDQECSLGDVHFNQRTITRPGDGTADIWIQVRHPYPQIFAYETETHETTVRYEVERLHYRFKCAEQQFLVVERQIMGGNDQVVARDEPAQIYRAPVSGSVTTVIMPIACRGT